VIKLNFDYEARPLWDITCDECGKPAQVPFEPDGVRKVFCKDCLYHKRQTEDNRRIEAQYANTTPKSMV